MQICGVFPGVSWLERTGEAHEDEDVQSEQVRQEEVSGASPTRQQSGEVQAAAAEPPSTGHHPTFDLHMTDTR